MKFSNWLQQATTKLDSAGIGTARLDALVLAEDTTGHDRAYLLAHPDLVVRDPISHKLDAQIERRIQHEPLAYIRGFTEFYGRKFGVDERVLEPRPESETMIDLLKKTVRGQTSHIIDVGTGSGALAITAKLEHPKAEVVAIDIDSNCLKVARDNAKFHKVNIKFQQGNLLESLPTSKYQIPYTILANLPYVPENFTINQAALHEPKLAIFGGLDGLDVYRNLFKQIGDRKLDINFIFTESMPPQHSGLSKIAYKYDFKHLQTQDFIQVFTKN